MTERITLAEDTREVPSSPTYIAYCGVFRVANRFEAVVRIDHAGDEKPPVAHRYRANDLDQLVAIATSAEDRGMPPGWRTTGLESIREAVYRAQDALHAQNPSATLPAAKSGSHVDPARDADKFNVFDEVNRDAILFVDPTAERLAMLIEDPDGVGHSDRNSILLIAAAIVAARRSTASQFGRNEILKQLDHARKRLVEAFPT